LGLYGREGVQIRVMRGGKVQPPMEREEARTGGKGEKESRGVEKIENGGQSHR